MRIKALAAPMTAIAALTMVGTLPAAAQPGLPAGFAGQAAVGALGTRRLIPCSPAR